MEKLKGFFKMHQYLSIYFCSFYFLWSVHRHYLYFTQSPLVIFSLTKEMFVSSSPDFDSMSNFYFSLLFLPDSELIFYLFSTSYKGAFVQIYLNIARYHGLTSIDD